jgi:hypothetical protein
MKVVLYARHCLSRQPNCRRVARGHRSVLSTGGGSGVRVDREVPRLSALYMARGCAAFPVRGACPRVL